MSLDRLDQKRIAKYVFVLIIGYPYINIVFNCVISSIIGANSIDTMLQIGITVLFSIFLLSFKYKEFPKDCLFASAILAALMVSTAIIYPNNYEHLSLHLGEIIFAFCAYIVIRVVGDIEVMMGALKVVNYFAFISGIFLALTMNGMFYIPGGEGLGYMVFGYKMLPAAILSTYFWGESKKKRLLLMAIISILCIVVFGSRGALLAYVGFLVLWYIFINKTKSTKKIAVVTFVCILLVLLSNETVILGINELLSDLFGYNSRTMEMALSGNIDSDSGRDIIQEMAFAFIKENWFVGGGIYADRLLEHPWLGTGNYIHNFFLEVIIDFGVPCALVLFYWILSPIVKACFRYQDVDRDITIIFFSCWFFGNLFSDTFWTNPFFYSSIAIACTLRKKQALQGGGYNDI